ncbi:MAG: nitroreductase family protein [Chloroflexi bacterium]|nr:nitroreductase family protein [Chloroflexota bacterium]
MRDKLSQDRDFKQKQRAVQESRKVKTMDVLQAIRTKHAVRKFSDQPVSDDVILKILDAGRRSQSSKNTQPWSFIVVRDRERLAALSRAGTYASHLADAAFAVVLVGSQRGDWHSFDLGQASSYLQLAAWELGIGSCIATLHMEDEARAILDIPADSGLFLALSMGYPAADWVKAKMGGRKALEEIVHWEKW